MEQLIYIIMTICMLYDTHIKYKWNRHHNKETNIYFDNKTWENDEFTIIWYVTSNMTEISNNLLKYSIQ